MELISLGHTGLEVSPIGLGLAALGRPGYINVGHGDDLAGEQSVPAMAARTYDMLALAYDCGIRYFDAARSYGRAEEFLAGWLEGPGANLDVTIGSKWGYTYTADWRSDAAVHEVKDHNVAAFERQIAETDAVLGLRVRVYQIHSATLETGVLEDGKLHRRLASLRERGVAIGFSTSGPRQGDTIRRALDVEVDGVPLFGTVQSTWNLLETSAGAALEEAADAGLGVIVKEAVANGRLTSRNRDLPPPLGADPAPDAIAMAAALAQPWASVVLSGAATPDQLRSNLRALDVDDTTIAELPNLAEPSDRYWEVRSELPWT